MESEPRRSLPRFSVYRPVTVVMILLALLVVGFIAYTRIPIALNPEGLEGNSLSIFVRYPNATPLDVEEKVARPIEGIIGTVPNVSRIRSFNSSGSCWIRVEFHPKTDLKAAYAELRDRMDRVMPEMPEDIDRISVRRWDENDVAVMNIAAQLPPHLEDPFYAIDHYIRPSLQRIEGVGNVEIWGAQGQELNIELDQDRIRSYGIDTFALVNQLRGQNFVLSGGYVIEGERKMYVRSLGQFETLDDIRNLPISAQHNLTLADLAEVSIKAPRRTQVYRINGAPGLGIEIKRASTGNIVDISGSVRAALVEIEKIPQLQGIAFEIFFDQGHQVRESINNLKTSGLWGGLFAAAVLFVFLRAARMTAILTLAIPLSILSSIAFMYFWGWSLNTATMMGLLLSLGMVIDNSIVIVENIFRRRQGGMPAREASISGAEEMGLAVTMATLTTVIVFLPLILMSDNQHFSFWMFRIGLPVIASLISSLLIALVFIPLAAQRLSTGKRRSEPKTLGFLRERYLTVLAWALRRRLDAFLIITALMLTVLYPAAHVKYVGQQRHSSDNPRLWFDMPTGQPLEETEAFFRQVERTVMEHGETYNMQVLESRFRGNSGSIQVVQKKPASNAWYAVAFEDLRRKVGLLPPSLTREEIQEDIRSRIEAPVGINVRTNWRDRDSTDSTSFSLNLYGDDTEMLASLAGEVERRLSSIPGVISVDTEMERSRSELQIILDRDQTRRLGLNPRTVSSTISNNLRGANLSRFQTPEGREIDVRVQLGEEDRQNIAQLRQLTFPTLDGTEVPLESISRLNVAPMLGRISRENRKTSLRVTATAARADSRQLFSQIDRAMEGFEMPRGYSWDKGSRFTSMREADRSQRFALLISGCFVFLLMGILFESFLLPLAVIVSVPFAFLGVFWTLYLTDTPFDMMSSIGMVILVGVVVNNAIVLVDLTNRLRAGGMERLQALLEAGRHRFRPILMTTFTTMCGLIPMAVGNSKMVGMAYAPLGRTMIGGLLVAMVITLVLVPLFYTLLDDLRELLKRVAATAAWKKTPQAEETAAKP